MGYPIHWWVHPETSIWSYTQWQMLSLPFSYGQKKKAMIAFAISCKTKYLFMDEPTNGLDIPSKALFRSIIASTYDENRITIISTHQVRDLQSLIDNVIILNDQQIQFNVSMDQVSEKL